MRTFVSLALLALVACASKSTAPPPASPPAAAAPATTAPADATGANTYTCAPDEAKATCDLLRVFDSLAGVIEGSKEDCKVMATGLDAWSGKHGEELTRVTKEVEALSKAEQQLFQERHGDELGSIIERMMPGMAACESDPGVQAAIKKLSL
jgi:hypothetical protein